MIKIDTASKGYAFLSRAEQERRQVITWLGAVNADGVTGALGLNRITGNYCLFRNGDREPMVLDAMQVLAALAEPVRFNPPGRKPPEHGAGKQCCVVLDAKTIEAARLLGDGNLSAGVRAAVFFAATRADPITGKLPSDERQYTMHPMGI